MAGRLLVAVAALTVAIMAGVQPAALTLPPAQVARLLVGRWRVVQRHEPPRGVAENLLVRTSDLTGVRQWRWITFSPPQSLILSDGTHTTRLQYAAENGDIDLAPEGQNLDHDDWQVMFTAGMLYLRSLADDTTLVLIRDPSAPGR